MRTRSFIFALGLAWLLATGSHWGVVQTFGWAKMFATYARTLPLDESLRRTFSGQELCGVCELVQSATQQQSSDGAPAAPSAATEKLVLLAPVQAFACQKPGSTPRLSPRTADVTRSEGRAAPPLPPPRAHLA